MGRWWRTLNLPTPKGHFVLKCLSFVLLRASIWFRCRKYWQSSSWLQDQGGWHIGREKQQGAIDWQVIGVHLPICTWNMCTCTCTWVLTICRHPKHFARATPPFPTWCHTFTGLEFVAKTILVLYLITPIRNTAIRTTAWSPKDQQWSSHHFLLLLWRVSGTE